LIGLSLVILMFGTGSPIIGIVPSEGWRRLITGFLFGTTGALIALSPVGKESGAHINPVVTLGFWLMHKLDTRTPLAMSSRSWQVRVRVFCHFLPGVRWAGARCSAPLCRVKAIPSELY